MNGILKIGDFGLSTRIGQHHDPDSEGDKVYMAPEVLSGNYGKSADIFSLGLVALELAADVVLPGEGDSWAALRNAHFHELMFEDISPRLVSLIFHMMTPSPEQRPTIEQLLQILELQSSST